MPFTPNARSSRHSNLQWDPSPNHCQPLQLPFSNQTTVGFGGIDDSNDSFVLQFAASPSASSRAMGASGIAMAAIPAAPSFDDSDVALMDWDTDLGECHAQPPAFRSSPSEPFYFGRRPPPAGGSSSNRLTAVASAPAPMPPPAEARRTSVKRPSSSITATAAAATPADFTDDDEEQQQQMADEDTENVLNRRSTSTSSKRDRGTPKRRKIFNNSSSNTCLLSASRPLGDLTNSSNSPSGILSAEFSGKSKPHLHRCVSELACGNYGNAASKAAALDSARVDRAIASIDSLNLIGNSEQQHSLPTVQELNYGIRHVTGVTVSRLVNGGFTGTVANYTIIDCRYPYEFSGGHITGAVNIYTQEDLLEQVFNPACSSGPVGSRQSRPTVLIFHCEFSSERAPKLARYLRQRDRDVNASNYPELYFPEVYVLQGGYKAFYEAHKTDCQPSSYVRMADPVYKAELAQFQRAGKAWERQNSRSRHSQLERMVTDRLLF